MHTPLFTTYPQMCIAEGDVRPRRGRAPRKAGGTTRRKLRSRAIPLSRFRSPASDASACAFEARASRRISEFARRSPPRPARRSLSLRCDRETAPGRADPRVGMTVEMWTSSTRGGAVGAETQRRGGLSSSAQSHDLQRVFT